MEGRTIFLHGPVLRLWNEFCVYASFVCLEKNGDWKGRMENREDRNRGIVCGM